MVDSQKEHREAGRLHPYRGPMTFSDVPPIMIDLPERGLPFKKGTVRARIVLGTISPHIEIIGSTGTRIGAMIRLTDDDIKAMMDGCERFRSATVDTILKLGASSHSVKIGREGSDGA